MGTPYQRIYEAFLSQIESDEWEAWELLEAEEDWRQILDASLPLFRFPRIDLRARNEYGFEEEVGNEEIQVLVGFMKAVWLERVVNSWENLKPLYSERDFSPATMLNELRLKSTRQWKLAQQSERTYYRAENGDPFQYSKMAGSITPTGINRSRGGFNHDLEVLVRNAEEERQQNEEFRKEAEVEREHSELDRKALEAARQKREGSRQEYESIRRSAEERRDSSERVRLKDEELRVKNEKARHRADIQRQEEELNRDSYELERQRGEENRRAAESSRDSAESQRVESEVARSKAEEARKAFQTNLQNSEGERVQAETLRKAAERERASEETQRSKAEQARELNESNRSMNEADRRSEEATRRKNEVARSANENDRIEAEKERVKRQDGALLREELRQENERTRVTSEDLRNGAEIKRETREQNRETAELSRLEKEKLREQVETDRAITESIRKANEVKREENEVIRIDNEKTRITAEDSRAIIFNEMTESLEDYKTPLATDTVAGKVKVDKIPTETGVITVPSVGKLSEEIQLRSIQYDSTDTPGGKISIGEESVKDAFFGEVSSEELITGDDLALKVGLTAGNSVNSNGGWLKFMYKGRIQFVAKKHFRINLSWENLNSLDLMYGNQVIDVKGLTYKIRLFRGVGEDFQPDPKEMKKGIIGSSYHNSEWNALMCPISEEAPDKWLNPGRVREGVKRLQKYFSSEELDTKEYASICQEIILISNDKTRCVSRGYGDTSGTWLGIHTIVMNSFGWRPVLELVE